MAGCLGGMDDPAKRDWRRKIETRASSLAGGLFFRRPTRPATASKPLFIRAQPCHPWFIFPFQPRSARSLLNCKQLSLGVLGGQSLQAEIIIFSKFPTITTYCKPHFFSELSEFFDSLAPTRLTLRANLRLLYLKDPAFSIAVKIF